MANIVDKAFGTPTGDAALILGDVIFGHMEVPDSLNFGGSQMLSMHQLVGGARVINALGRSDEDISWNGFFFGEAAFERARALDFIRTHGVKIELVFGELIYFGIIKSFHADLQRVYQIPYSIIFTIIENLSIPVPFPTPNGYNDAVNDDMTSVSANTPTVDNPQLTSAVGSLQQSIKDAGNLASATQQQLINITNNIQACQTINNNIINTFLVIN